MIITYFCISIILLTYGEPMIEYKKVTDTKYNEKTVHSYVLVNNGVPLLLPSAFLLHTAIEYPSLNTSKTYMFALKSFYEQVTSKTNLTDIDIENLTEKEMSGYLVGILKKERNVKASTIKHHITVLKEFFKYLYDSGLISKEIHFSYSYLEEPTEEDFLPGITTEMHDAYFDEQTFKKSILGYVGSERPFIQERNELILKLGYHAGLRAAEVIDPRNLNINTLRELLPESETFIPKSIHMDVFGKGLKYRSVPFPPELTRSIYAYIWGNGRHIKTGNIICRKNGGSLVDTSFATNLFRQCADDYCLDKSLTDLEHEIWKKRSHHKLRKCAATNWVTSCYENGDDPWIYIPQWLGHKSIATTFKYIYFEALFHKRADVLEALSLESTKYGKKFKKKFENSNG